MENILNNEIKYYDLTIPQENIWLIEQLYPTANINNICGTFFINKTLNLDILKKAINKIIENNDALRIRINLIDSKPVQYINEFEFDDLPIYYLEDDDQTKINSIINAFVLEHINIFNNKLYDFRLISTPTSVYICVKMHHLIADAWSMGQVFLENIKKYYIEIEENRIIDKKTSYIDYIKRNEEYKKSEKYLRDEEFWENYVKNINSTAKYAITKNRATSRIVKTIDNTLHNRIISFCENNNISEFAFYMGIISIYFSKLFNDENIIIATPFFNRQKSQKEFDIMGMFVVTLPIIITVRHNLTFLELCKKITSTNMSCFKHSQFPFSEIQKKYNNLSGTNTNLCEIAFSYQKNNLEDSFDSNTYKTTWLPNNEQSNPILISYVNHFGEHQFCYDFLQKFFSNDDINDLHERFIHIIKHILRNTEGTIEGINILCENDLNLLKEFNNTGDITLENETIVSRFKKIVNKNKAKIALKYNDIELTYKELDKKSNSVANSLIKQKIKKGTPVAIIFDKSIEMFVAMLGIMKAGCYYVPILPQEENARAEYIIKNSEAQLLITEKKYFTQIPSSVIQNKIIIDDLLNENFSEPNINIKPTDLCYFIYTSGSTGGPKGVMIKHENVISLMESMNHHENLKYYPEDIAISLLKYSFDASAIDIYSMLLNGGKLIIVPKEIELDPAEVTKLISNEKVTRFFTVAKWIEQVQKVARKQNIDISSVRLIGTGGEVLKPQKFKYLAENYPNINFCNTYGPTETTVMMTCHKVNERDIEKNFSPIGELLPFSRAIVMSQNSNEILPINSKGELVMFEDETSMHNITKGYFKLDEKTKKHFIRFVNPFTHKLVNGYRSGDLVKINRNLELEFFGRDDDFKKVNGGYLVSLTEVENKIQRILGTTVDISVVSIPVRNTNSIMLFVAKRGSSANVTLADIKSEIDKNLTFYMRPKKIFEIEKLPLTRNGKIHKRQLEDFALKYYESKTEFILPTNKTEQHIYDIVKEIVNTDFSITDDFEEDLGIDSLNITTLYSKLNNNKISIQDLYNYPTVKDLAYLFKKECYDDEPLETDRVKIINTSTKMNLEKVILTGTTGFVGIHLLKELAENEETQKIYCIIRHKLNFRSEERFEILLHNYFDEETCKKIKKKAVVLNGDLRKEDLGLEPQIYNRVLKDAQTIINPAANVKHMGKYSASYTDNVETVNNLINVCLKFNLSLAHISTLSLNGYHNKNVTEIFTENTLNINQTFNRNPYLISKFEAEQVILKNIVQNNLNAKIFRIGNIMPRISDGVFQINYEQNGFILAINTLSQLKIITEEMENIKLLLTPVDDCCRAINTLLKSDYCNTIYHIENPKKIKLSSIIEILKGRNIDFSTVSYKALQKALNNNYSIGGEHLKAIFNSNQNKYTSNITLEIFNELNFEWEPIKKDYLDNLINIAMKIK